jgi:methyl-accepting chemotaxis protein
MEQIFVSAPPQVFLAISLGLLCSAFVLFYLVPAVSLGANLRQMQRALANELSGATGIAPEDVSIADPMLQQEWWRYCKNLSPRLDTGGEAITFSTDVHAASVLSSKNVVEQRVHVQYFQYFPRVIIAIAVAQAGVSLIDAFSVGGQSLAQIPFARSTLVFAAAVAGLGLLIALLKFLTLSWLETILATICTHADALYFSPKASGAAGGTSLEAQEAMLKKEVAEILCAPLENLGSQQTASFERLFQCITQLQLGTTEVIAGERDALTARIEELSARLADDTKAIADFHLATAQQLSEQARHALDAFATDAQMHGEAIKTASEGEISRFCAEARRSVESLSDAAALHREAIQSSTDNIRGAANELATTVSRASESAANVQEAASSFLRAGLGLSSVFDKSTGLAKELSLATDSLTAATEDIGEMTGSYRASREAFSAIAAELQAVLAPVRQDMAARTDLGKQLETASGKLIELQEQLSKRADEHVRTVALAVSAINEPTSEIRTSVAELKRSTAQLAAIADGFAPRADDGRWNHLDTTQAQLEQALEEFRRAPLRQRAV